MAKKNEASGKEDTFRRRLARLRWEAGYSQRWRVGSSNRMVDLYEAQTRHTPAHILATLADSLGLSDDQLLRRKLVTARKARETRRVLRELRRVEKLPARARQAHLETID